MNDPSRPRSSNRAQEQPAGSESDAEPPARSADGIDRLLLIMARLRDPDGGCPWDVEQSFATIAPYTIEEAYEVAEAIELGDMPALKDELGDLLLQVVFHARMAEEAGHFAFSDVCHAICEKMVRRHPHVFANTTFASRDAQKRDWEQQKADERAAKGYRSALDGVTAGLPALTRALKLQNRAARVGFDWPKTDLIVDKVEEELQELKDELAAKSGKDRLEDELGDLFFVLVNLARRLDVDPESALRRSNAKFNRRFQTMERSFLADGRKLDALSLEEMETGWQAAKRLERDETSD